MPAALYAKIFHYPANLTNRPLCGCVRVPMSESRCGKQLPDWYLYKWCPNCKELRRRKEGHRAP